MDKSRVENLSLFVLFLGASVLLFFVFAPFVAALSLAAVFAILLHAPYEKLLRRSDDWKSAIALLTVALMLVFFIVPLFFLGAQIVREAQLLYTGMSAGNVPFVETAQAVIGNPLQQLFPGFVLDVNASVGHVLAFVSDNLGSLVYQTFSVLFNTFLMLFALFFFLRDGRGFLTAFARISPLGTDLTNDILEKMYRTIRAVVQGTLFVALVRWILLGIAFSFFGIPNALLWSSIGSIIGAIPGVGTPVALVGAVAYLYLAGNVPAAVALALLGIVVVALVDNLLTSYFFSKGLEVAPVFVLFSILGGIVFFGLAGFVLGPLVLSVFLAVIRVYRRAGD